MSNIIDSIQVSGTVYTIQGSGGGSGNPTVEVTQAEYDALVSAGTVSANTYYIITDASEVNPNDYVKKADNVVSGYTTYQLFDAPESPSFYNLTIDEILVRRCNKEGVNTETHTVYLKNSNNQSISTSLSLNWTDKTGSTSQDISLSVTWSDSLDGFVIVDNNTSYPYFDRISPALSPQVFKNYRYYYKVDDVQSQQSAAYLNGIDKGVEADYVVGFPNLTSLSSDGSLMIELLKEKTGSISHNYKVCNTNDFDWGVDGISYKLVNGEGHYETLPLDGIYCQVPQTSPSKYEDAYLSLKFKINPSYSSQDYNNITLYLGGASDKTQTYWSTSSSLTFYYNGSTDTIDTNGIVGRYDIYSINYDQTTHYVTIDMNIYQTYNGYYWAIKQVGHGNCWIGTNYQITEFQYYTTKYKPFDYLDSVKQDTLVSGTNIKTINNESILGSGNIDIQGGGVDVVQTTGTSTTDVMSQDAVTTKLNTKLDVVRVEPKTPTSNYTQLNLYLERNGYGSQSLFTYVKTINGKSITSQNNDNLEGFSLIETSAITTSVTSSSTDAQVPSAKAVNDKLGGLSLVKLTQSAYDALSPNYDSNTLYVIVN